MSEQRTDSAAQAATDLPDTQGPAPAAAAAEPAAPDEQPPVAEGDRELRETVRSIHRLEESN